MASASYHVPTGHYPSKSPARASVPAFDPGQSALRIFDNIPELWHGVIAVDGDGAAPLLRKGEVAVYEDFHGHPHYGELIHGGLYAIEYQSTRSAMSREMFARLFVEGYGGCRLEVRRKIVRVSFHRDAWWVQSIEASPTFFGRRGFVCKDGPYHDPILLTDKLIGIVVGIYRGAAAPIGGAA